LADLSFMIDDRQLVSLPVGTASAKISSLIGSMIKSLDEESQVTTCPIHGVAFTPSFLKKADVRFDCLLIAGYGRECIGHDRPAVKSEFAYSLVVLPL
jgi:hypothetical protein